MKTGKYFGLIFFILLLCQCSNPKQSCIAREWKVMDLYRNTFPSLVDTVCDNKILLVNKLQVDRSFLDSVFKHLDANRAFSLDTEGAYNVNTSTTIKVNGVNYKAAKVKYLSKGQNIDQEFLLYVVKDKGVYIQQESHDRKLYLLMSVRNAAGQLESTGDISEAMIRDTILFPLPPGRP
jgi:hypothetical protein